MQIIGICGYSGSGKTTLLKKLIPLLKQYNIRLAVIKHCHHNMDIDKPGKDSDELRKSGADQLILANDQRWVLMTETLDNPPKLVELAKQFKHVDLVLVEGFKHEAITKIICYRHTLNKPLFSDPHTIAIATDIELDIPIKQFAIDDSQSIALFIKNYVNSHQEK